MNIAELALKSPIKPSKELLSASDNGGGILASMISHATEIYSNSNAGSLLPRGPACPESLSV